MTLTTYLNSQFSIAQNLDFFLRILLACLCGADIGFERSRRLKEAGIRTHVIVCCAAALLMIVSKYGFADLTSATGEVFAGTRGADPARVAAQVGSGNSFPGAGVSIKHGNTSKGMTTPAGSGATPGNGLAIGRGMIVVGIFTTIVVAVLQIFMHRLVTHAEPSQTSHVQFTVTGSGEFPTRFADFLSEHRVQIVQSNVSRQEDGSALFDVTLRAPHDVTMRGMKYLLESKEVSSINCLPVNG